MDASSRAIASHISAFESTLQAAGTVERANHEKAYLKSDLNFYGTAVPVIHKTAKTFSKMHPHLTHDELIQLVDVLWQSSYHEMRSLGLALLDHYPQLITLNDVEFLEKLMRQMATWAHIDWIAGGAIATLVKHNPAMKSVLKRWATDESFWVRRTAMLALIKQARMQRDAFDLFAQFASQMIDEREFFIRKAIGWVLREVSKHQPNWTYEFLSQHIQHVSGLTLREGAKYLPEEQRETLMQQYKMRSK